MEQDSQPGLEDATFQSLLVACLEQLERGEELDRDALVREHPQFAEPLKEFLADQAMLREVATGVRDSRERSPAKPAVDHFDDETIDSSPKAGADSSAGETIRYVGEHEGRHYFTMDFVDGRSLAEEIREESLPPRRAAEIVRTAAETVHFAHEQGTVHRDLKPANVLLPADDVPHITDFGLAKMSESVDEESRAELTASCQILGAPSYMSPEQASGKQELVGPASDIYSLGAILYACLTGRAPFVADSPVDTRLQVMKKERVSPRELNPSVPKDLETICLKCLIKELHKRYGTAREPADDLQRFLEGRPVVARPISPIRKAARWCRRNKAVAALLCLLFLSMAVGTDASASYAVAAVRHAQKEDRARAHAETAREQAEEQRRKAEAAQREAEEQRDIATKAKAQAGWSLSREAGARRESDRARKAEADARRTAEDSLAKEEAARRDAEQRPIEALWQTYVARLQPMMYRWEQLEYGPLEAISSRAVIAITWIVACRYLGKRLGLECLSGFKKLRELNLQDCTLIGDQGVANRIKLTYYLPGRQVPSLEKAFLKEGGLREAMTRARLAARKSEQRRGTEGT